MSSQGEGQEGDGDCAHRQRRVVRQDAVAILNNATVVMRAAGAICMCVPAELAGAARRCRRPLIIGMLRPFFLSAQRNKQFFLHVTCWSASMLPKDCHAALSSQCSSRAPHCTRGSLSLGLFAGPWPAVSIGRLLTFFPNFCMLLRGAGE
ncbi:hypothetical protein TcG_11290 [Trypanosoma cruzi]|nr:hypothetical protein TcG_11290 [Trypanosoma cruzi]